MRVDFYDDTYCFNLGVWVIVSIAYASKGHQVVIKFYNLSDAIFITIFRVIPSSTGNSGV